MTDFPDDIAAQDNQDQAMYLNYYQEFVAPSQFYYDETLFEAQQAFEPYSTLPTPSLIFSSAETPCLPSSVGSLAADATTNSDALPTISNDFSPHDQWTLQEGAVFTGSPEALRLTSKRKRDSSCGLVARQDALLRYENPRTVVKRDAATGIVQAYQHTFGTHARAVPTPEQRRKTALSRALGVCERCRQKKYRCDVPSNPYQACNRCQRAHLLLHRPCIRVEILEINLHRLGSTTNTALADWMATQNLLHPRKVLLTQDMGKLPAPTMVIDGESWQRSSAVLEVTVAPFHPEEGDTTAYTWLDSNGVAHQLHLPTYYITNLEEASLSMQQYVQQHAAAYIESIPESTNCITRKVFSEACRFYSVTGSELVRNALDFWAATRITELYWRLCGDDTLGCAPITDPESPWFDKIPVSPVMDTQLDEIAIRSLLLPIKKAFLRRLKLKIEKNKKEDWYEVFLAVFIILSNVEYILADMMDFSLTHAIPAAVPGRTALSEGFVHASKTVLAYFHFACHGAAPLRTKLARCHDAALNGEQIAFLEALRREVKRQGQCLTNLRSGSMYSDMYWCYQLLVEGWDAAQPIVGSLDRLTEEDLLLTA